MKIDSRRAIDHDAAITALATTLDELEQALTSMYLAVASMPSISSPFTRSPTIHPDAQTVLLTALLQCQQHATAGLDQATAYYLLQGH